jgi:predicted nucleic acid-binding protein
MSSPIVVLDACVLIPDWLRDLFLRAAEKNLLQLRWTKEILEEMRRNLELKFGVSAESGTKLVRTIAAAFDDGEVANFERHIDKMTNDAKDRHVMAAALEASIDGEVTIVTFNLRDFPPISCPPNITVQHPDSFLLELCEEHAAAFVDILWAHAQRRKRPPVSVEELLGGLAKQVPRFVNHITSLISVRTDDQLEFVARRLIEAMESGNSSEFLVAIQDQVLVDPSLARKLTEQAENHRLEIAQATLKLLSELDEPERLKFMAFFRRYGVTLSAEEMLRLSPLEFDALMDRFRHGTQ